MPYTTIKKKDFTSAHRLADVLYVKKKDDLLKIAKRLDFWISPNVSKDKIATRLANAMLSEPIEVVSRLSKTELLILEEILDAGPNAYIEKKMRKTPYMLQKWGLVLTYEDEESDKWHLLMPDEVREALEECARPYIALAKEDKPRPSAKELRMRSVIADLLGTDDFTIVNGMVIRNTDKPQ